MRCRSCGSGSDHALADHGERRDADDHQDHADDLETPQSEGGSSAVELLHRGQTGADCSVCRAHSWSSRVAVQRFVDAGEHRNELVMRVQPDEALYMLTVAKEPGITTEQVRICPDLL